MEFIGRSVNDKAKAKWVLKSVRLIIGLRQIKIDRQNTCTRQESEVYFYSIVSCLGSGGGKNDATLLLCNVFLVRLFGFAKKIMVGSLNHCKNRLLIFNVYNICDRKNLFLFYHDLKYFLPVVIKLLANQSNHIEATLTCSSLFKNL